MQPHLTHAPLKLDAVREALRFGDIDKAQSLGRIFRLTLKRGRYRSHGSIDGAGCNPVTTSTSSFVPPLKIHQAAESAILFQSWSGGLDVVKAFLQAVRRPLSMSADDNIEKI